MSMASRHASQASCRSTQTGPFTRTVTLPPHVEEVLHAKPTSALRQLQVSGQGLHSPSTLLPSLDRRTKLLPWERPADVTKQSRTDSVTEVGLMGKRHWGLKVDGKEALGLKVDGKEALGLKVDGKEALGLKVDGKEALGLKVDGKEALGLKVYGKEALGLKIDGKEALGLKIYGKEALGLKVDGKEALGLKVDGKEALGLKIDGKEALGLKIDGKAALGLKVDGKEALGLKIDGKEALGLNVDGKEALGLKIDGKEALGLKIDGKEALGLKLDGKAALGLKIYGKEALGLKIDGKEALGLKLDGKAALGLKVSVTMINHVFASSVNYGKFVSCVLRSAVSFGQGGPVLRTVRSKSGFGRQRKVTQHSNQIGDNRYLKLYEVIDSNPYGKISFTNSNEPMHPIAGWVIHQLEHSCRSARFALPSNYSSLEDMTPLEYLEKYTILSRTQRRKYNLIFAKYMDRQEKVLLFERLYPALNSMFADSLGRENFKTLCVSLFIGKDLKIQSKELFAGICALTERLFWSSYMEAHDNTFFICGENRSLLECADFCGLKGKIQDLNLSIEMRTLLFSLA
ncbi:hypothetical protein RRG08_019951 [Elysia crispata]|uniref:Uncharacterized protein n=1 Tax=Elysia crispata TaxID=231223 RepID=A0AAE0Y7V7_9GAST|nr:hypothetical protein RRG08_019951 [Elysia crispata]